MDDVDAFTIAPLGVIGKDWVVVDGDADCNGDRKADILWCNPVISQVAIWQMRGTDAVSTKTYGGISSVRRARDLGGDCNGEGASDILWENRGMGSRTWSPASASATRPATGC